MTRRTPSQYDFDKALFDERILTKHFTPQASKDVKFIVIHHMAMKDADVNKGDAIDAAYRVWQTRKASAHYVVDGRFIGQLVWDKDYAWATGSTEGNKYGISIEHVNLTGNEAGTDRDWLISEETWKNGAKLTAYLHKIYGLGRPVKNKTIRKHNSFTSTACPGPYFNEIWDRYCAEAQRVYDAITKPSHPEVPQPEIVRHTVKAGDTLYRIGKQYGVSWQSIQKANQLATSDISVGQVLVIPSSSSEPPTPSIPSRPADVIDMSQFKWTSPEDKEVKQPDLAKMRSNKYCYVTADGLAVAFRAYCGGKTTEHTKYSRSELRQTKGSKETNWNPKTQDSDLRATYMITAQPRVKPEQVIMQIHNGKDDVMQVRHEGTHLFVTINGKFHETLDRNCKLHTKFTLTAGSNRKTGIRVQYQKEDSTRVITTQPKKVTGSNWYWKLGEYVQSNVDKGDRADAFGEVLIFKGSLRIRVSKA
jgi:LysM repeat protein